MRNINFNNLFNDSRRDASMMLIKKCPLCNNNYLADKLAILDDRGNTFLAHLSCTYCGSHLIIRVVASPHGLVGTASITDLQANEVLSFNEEKELSADEIIELIGIIKKGELMSNIYIN